MSKSIPGNHSLDPDRTQISTVSERYSYAIAVSDCYDKDSQFTPVHSFRGTTHNTLSTDELADDVTKLRHYDKNFSGRPWVDFTLVVQSVDRQNSGGPQVESLTGSAGLPS